MSQNLPNERPPGVAKDQIFCPYCGTDYVHFKSIRIYNRGLTIIVTPTSLTMTKSDEISYDDPQVEITYWCENVSSKRKGHHTWIHRERFHGGQITVFENLLKTEPQWVQELRNIV